MLPATHLPSKFTARQSLLFVWAPPSLPAIQALRDFISSKWRLEREASKLRGGRGVHRRRGCGWGEGKSTESGPRLSPIVQVTTH